MISSEKEIQEKTWEEFRDNGLIWLVNTTLHIFGWAIVVEFKDKKITRCFPARVKYRGFSEKTNEKGVRLVSAYLAKNANKLKEESE